MLQPSREQIELSTTVTDRRLELLANGYAPIPLYGKEPPIYGRNNQHKGLTGWQALSTVTAEQIKLWEKNMARRRQHRNAHPVHPHPRHRHPEPRRRPRDRRTGTRTV